MVSFSHSFYVTAVALAVAIQCSVATAQVDPAGAVQRSIEGSQSRIPSRPARSLADDLQDLSGAVALERLSEVVVQGEALREEVLAYWQPFLGRSVGLEQTVAFKEWFQKRARSNGFLAYALTEADGQKLVITQSMPRVRSIRVFARDEALARLYLKELNARFEADFKPGSPLDVQTLEHKLDAVAFSLPLELDVVVRLAGPELLDLSVNVNEAPLRTGQVLGGLAQINNYGLSQFGSTQLLGQVAIGGHMPSARLTMTGQLSEGIAYGRADYDMPLASQDARMRFAASTSRSEGVRASQSRTVGESVDLSWGLEKLLGYHRETVYRASGELLARQTHSRLSSNGVDVSRVHDQQLRLKWSADSDRLSAEPMRLEISAVMGHYSELAGLPNAKLGQYSKLEFMARKQVNLTPDGQVFGLARLRGQHASRHLDGYNQISTGGINGVRAYTSVDGVGNDGLVASLELTHRAHAQQLIGVFYDGALVRPSKSPLPGLYDGTYRLQAFGAQVSGQVRNFNYNVTLAKGVGGNRGALPSDTESSPDNWRLSVAGTYLF